MSIQFRFHPEKAVEAAATLLKLHDREPMKYLGLLKMLYIADRIALQRIEQPITGDSYVSMDRGPVLSGVYDLIKGLPVGDALPLWSRFISPRNSDYDVRLLSDPGDGELCEEEEAILKEVYQSFGHIDPFAVCEWTHDLPEWRDPHGSAIPILVEDILHNVGKTKEQIEEIDREVMREAYLDRVLHG
jgi:uncharacterized phage-associated protein